MHDNQNDTNNNSFVAKKEKRASGAASSPSIEDSRNIEVVSSSSFGTSNAHHYTQTAGTKRLHAQSSEGDESEEKRTRNRVSARNSRLQKKEQLLFLNKQLINSNEENRKLRAENQKLLQQSEALHAEVSRLRAYANQEAMTTRAAAVAAFQQQQQNIVARIPSQQALQELDTAIRQQALRMAASIQQQQHDALQHARPDVIGSLLRAFARRSGT